MEIPAGIRPDERVLILGIPSPAVTAGLSARLTNGLLVAIGDAGAVREARKAAQHLDNVMFVPGMPDELPWRDEFFTRVIDMHGEWPSPEKVRAEIERVTERLPNG